MDTQHMCDTLQDTVMKSVVGKDNQQHSCYTA